MCFLSRNSSCLGMMVQSEIGGYKCGIVVEHPCKDSSIVINQNNTNTKLIIRG